MPGMCDDPQREQIEDQRATDEGDAPHVAGDVGVLLGGGDLEARRTRRRLDLRRARARFWVASAWRSSATIAASSSAARASSSSVRASGPGGAGAVGGAVAAALTVGWPGAEGAGAVPVGTCGRGTRLAMVVLGASMDARSAAGASALVGGGLSTAEDSTPPDRVA